MKDGRGFELKQISRCMEGNSFIRVQTSVTNHGTEPVNPEYLTTFAWEQLSLCRPDTGEECHDLMRWRSRWSSEGRVEPRAIEEPGLIPPEF